jgi:hypothetical protein
VNAILLGALLAVAPAAPPVDEAPDAEQAPDATEKLVITPFVTLVGGAKYDAPIQGANEHKQKRFTTIALTDFGLRGSVGALLSFESELMLNGGTSLHGTSAFEGQAAMQVRRQLVRVTYGGLRVEVGRVVDEASVDFLSGHVGDTLYQDTALRDPLLYSGYNLGNGIRATFEIIDDLRVGIAFNAGNPVSSTSSLMVGGAFPPFDRFYSQPYQAIGKGPNNYPDDTFHMMVLTPSILYDGPLLQVHGAFQGFVVDTDTTRTDDDNIRGYNARGNVRLKLLDGMIAPFGNVSFARNDTVLASNVSKLAPDKYKAITAGGGVDFNIVKPFDDSEVAHGIGAQYEQVQYQVGSGNVTKLMYLNVGGTFWLTRHLALGARFSLWRQRQVDLPDAGERAGFVTLRAVL